MSEQPEPRARRVYVRDTENVRLEVDGHEVRGHAGESLAAAMLVHGFASNRRTPWGHRPRSAFCGMGACFECVVHVPGVGSVRSCMAAPVDGATVSRPGDSESV